MNVSNLKRAILQIGYRYNQDGYKFTLIEDRFAHFLIAKNVWKVQNTSKKTGNILTPGYAQFTFPIVLSPARITSQVEGDPTGVPEEGKKSKNKSSNRV